MVGIVHFSNFFRYVEAAETAFYRSLGLSITNMGVGWPRVHAEFDYKRPLRFEDTVQVTLTVVERRPRSIVYAAKVGKVEDGAVTECARGKVAIACVTEDPVTRQLTSTPIPAAVAALIEAAPEADIEDWMR